MNIAILHLFRYFKFLHLCLIIFRVQVLHLCISINKYIYLLMAKYFILLITVIFLISFLIAHCCYIETHWFLYIILVPDNIIYSFISFNSFLMDFLGYSMYTIISSTHGDWFTFSCLIYMPFISLVYIVALARTSSTTLSRSSKSWYYFLSSDLRRKVFSLSSLNIMLAVGFFICLFSKCLLSDWGNSFYA